MANVISWGCDVPVSMPSAHPASDTNIRGIGGGFIFTEFGMRFDLNRSDLEVFYTPLYSPTPSEYSATS